jgi:hypothetical protein
MAITIFMPWFPFPSAVVAKKRLAELRIGDRRRPAALPDWL